MLVRVQQWAQLGSGYPESRRGSTPQGSAFDSRLIGSKLSHIAQIIQVVETAVYRRMLVRIQLGRLSFVGEMIYLTVELNFHKTIIYYYYIKVQSRLVGLKSIKSYVKVNRSNTRNIRQVYRKGRPIIG